MLENTKLLYELMKYAGTSNQQLKKKLVRDNDLMICSIRFRTLFTAGPLGKYLNKTKHSVYNFAVLFPLCYVYVLRFWKNRCARICDLTLLCRCGKSILNVSIATRVLSKSLSNASVKQSRQTSKQASLAVAVGGLSSCLLSHRVTVSQTQTDAVSVSILSSTANSKTATFDQVLI